MRKPNKRLVHCAECGRNKRHVARGLCKRCYSYQWREEHPEYHCKWRADNRGRWAEYSRKWHANNREYGRRWCADNPERVAEKSHKWYTNNRERVAKYNRQWDKNNRAQRAEIVRRRRARKVNATIEPVDEAAIYELYSRICLYCGATEDLTLDHVVALASGGAHCEDNLVVACRKCNSSKRIKPLEDWLHTQLQSNVWLY